jgi:hypothetical protein
MTNRYGVDVAYFTKELAMLSRSLDDRTPEELERYLLRLSEVAKPPKKVERRKTVAPKRAVQQAKFSIMPADFEFCPHCSGSFSFRKLGKTFICPWCKKDVRTSIRLA